MTLMKIAQCSGKGGEESPVFKECCNADEAQMPNPPAAVSATMLTNTIPLRKPAEMEDERGSSQKDGEKGKLTEE